MGAEDLGQFIICSIIVLGEGVGNVVIGSTEPLAVFSDYVREEVGRIETSHFESNCHLDWVLSFLDEV